MEIPTEMTIFAKLEMLIALATSVTVRADEMALADLRVIALPLF
jgi:hypothetical protein